DIHAKEILRLRDTTSQILSSHTGQPLDRIERDVERDFIMTAEEAHDYGLVDQVIVRHE
ncbi:MAG: ATP-dependent Clp protease proteolytic subunit, partial [Acidobacteria bacterium]|nr:ATP-dependent Clp protease proteolytic subunit [Acidobacteriota bacterium]